MEKCRRDGCIRNECQLAKLLRLHWGGVGNFDLKIPCSWLLNSGSYIPFHSSVFGIWISLSANTETAKNQRTAIMSQHELAAIKISKACSWSFLDLLISWSTMSVAPTNPPSYFFELNWRMWSIERGKGCYGDHKNLYPLNRLVLSGCLVTGLDIQSNVSEWLNWRVNLLFIVEMVHVKEVAD